MAKVLARKAAHSKLYPVVLAFSLLAAPALNAAELRQNEISTYRNAINNAANGRSAQAVREVRRTNNDVAKDVVQWFALQQGSVPASFRTYAEFMQARPDWPRCVEIEARTQCDLLRKQAEARVETAGSNEEIIAFFQKNAPLTPKGLDAYARALQARGLDDVARSAIRTFWVDGSMTRDEQVSFFSRHSSVLTEADREARVDRLLWDAVASATKAEGDAYRSSARSAVPSLSSAGARAVALARLALQEDSGNAAALVNAVPASHVDDVGLAFDRARRLALNDNESAAARLLIAHGPSTGGHPGAWWKLRERVARELLARGQSDTAYTVSSQHGLSETDGVPYLTAEWTAGWIALRFRGDAERATEHFRRMEKASTSVISKARGAYWLGRSLQAQGNETNAQQWYAQAARYGTTFYGQIAAHELYGDVNVRPPGVSEEPDADAKDTFSNRDLVRAVRVGVEIGNHSVAKAFMNALADSSRSQNDATQAVRLGAELRRPDLAAWAAKRVGRLGYDVPVEGYPRLHFNLPSRPEAPLILSITRQESTFYQHARSGANAQGLMQLLPGTATQEAKRLGIPHQRGWLTARPEHNVKLGSSYLQGRIEGFDGSYIWGTAAYNAGPGNASKWVNRYGASGPLAIPSAARSTDPAHWHEIDRVEIIPFSETREYVQFVLAGTEVYRAILNSSGQPTRLQLRQNLLR